MEKHRICKICSKSFSSGKAMGGHMRSHLAKLPVPPKPPQQQPPPPQHKQQQQPTNWTELSPPFSSANGVMHSSSSVMNRSPSVDSGSETETETESHPRNPTRRRSKRSRKVVVAKASEPPLEAEQVSSVTDTFSTEDVAWCLIKLSRDKWDKWGKVKVKNEVDESVEMGDHDEEDEVEDESGFRAQARTRKYRCDTCNKAFTSYQALGGHRASHKKLKIAPVFGEDEDEDSEEIDGQNQKGNLVADQQRIFECSFCFKQFDSGQALGGHKKIHYYTNLANSGRINVSTSSGNSGDNLVIDLNLPAPEVEDEEFEFSTMSD